jgi:hypothetical protein
MTDTIGVVSADRIDQAPLMIGNDERGCAGSRAHGTDRHDSIALDDLADFGFGLAFCARRAMYAVGPNSRARVAFTLFHRGFRRPA